ncbi:MAG: hypothetical protein ACJ8IK_05965 [Burkholderiaceae bacterium]
MSDPQRPRDREPPRRATPLQPDKPGSGRRQENSDEQPEPSASQGGRPDEADKLARQEQRAVDNVREGYD